jgi:hypothetical protein
MIWLNVIKNNNISFQNIVTLSAQPAQETQQPGQPVIKLFYARNLRMFVISWSVCFWQAFPSKYYVCEQGRFWVLHTRVGSWPCPETYNWAGEACQGQTL